MKQNIYIYDNDRYGSGVWVSRNLIKSYQGGDCEEVTVEIPDSLEPYETEIGDIMVKRGDYFYSLDDCLCIDKDDRPYLKVMEPGSKARYLKIISRNGRRSLSFTI